MMNQPTEFEYTIDGREQDLFERVWEIDIVF